MNARRRPRHELDETLDEEGIVPDTRQDAEEAPTTQFDRTGPSSPLSTLVDPSSRLPRDGPPPHGMLMTLERTLEAFRSRARGRIGEVIAERYELRRLLGTGSAGAVFDALDLETKQEVAIKVLHEGLRSSSEHVSRFKREARAAASVGHGSVVEVLDAGFDLDGNVYIVLELLRGEGLFHAISRRSLRTPDVVEIGWQLLDALGAAHASGIVHRDVKPENIFLSRAPDRGVTVKLLDFGVAKYLRPDTANTFSTTEGVIIGTPHYMSPQMCLGQPVTEAADIWAAGAVLFHALAGHPPFDDDHIGKLLMKIVRASAPSIGTATTGLSDDLVRVIDRALLPDPDARWQTAREFAGALEPLRPR